MGIGKTEFKERETEWVGRNKSNKIGLISVGRNNFRRQEIFLTMKINIEAILKEQFSE